MNRTRAYAKGLVWPSMGILEAGGGEVESEARTGGQMGLKPAAINRTGDVSRSDRAA